MLADSVRSIAIRAISATMASASAVAKRSDSESVTGNCNVCTRMRRSPAATLVSSARSGGTRRMHTVGRRVQQRRLHDNVRRLGQCLVDRQLRRVRPFAAAPAADTRHVRRQAVRRLRL